jgi:hypothetical protein
MYDSHFYLCFYGYAAWSLTLKEEHKLQVPVSEDKVLRKIFAPPFVDKLYPQGKVPNECQKTRIGCIKKPEREHFYRLLNDL